MESQKSSFVLRKAKPLIFDVFIIDSTVFIKNLGYADIAAGGGFGNPGVFIIY
jgi:hypothetical protein